MRAYVCGQFSKVPLSCYDGIFANQQMSPLVIVSLLTSRCRHL